MVYKNIIWDFDGTLFDTYPALSSALEAAFLEKGIIEPAKGIEAVMRVSIGHAMAVLTEKHRLTSKESKALTRRFHELCDTIEKCMVRPFDRAADICGAVNDSGGANFLHTHRDKSAVYFLEKFDMFRYFTEVVTNENNFPRKPSPNAIHYLIRKHGLDRAETIMVGDRALDMLAAKNADISSCFFKVGDSQADFDDADYTIENLCELYSILDIADNIVGK